MMFDLAPEEKRCLNMASPEGFQKSASYLIDYFCNNSWLSDSNLYSSDPVERIKKDIRDGSLNSRDLREYIAVSIILHLVDGWEYLGQALYAQVRGAPISIHLGYYAEMRATMSLLATQGIGIFNRQHCIVDGEGITHHMPGERRSTHQAIWLYLEYWLRSRNAGSLLGQIIRPHSIPLMEWVNKLPCIGERDWLPSASKMFIRFGVDLKQMTDDRDLRNVASYRHFELSNHEKPSPSKAIEFLLETVRTLEPFTSQGGFNILDRYLLNQTVENAFKLSKSTTPQKNPAEFSRQVAVMLNEVLIGDNFLYQEKIKKSIVDDILYQNIPTLISLASDGYDISDPRPLLSRAVLLLRIATGAACEFMKDTNIEFDMLKFWWGVRGWQLGLWEDINAPLAVVDLWEDVSIALEEIRDWLNSDSRSAHSFFSNCAYSLQETTNLGRFALIGLSS